MLRFPNKNLLIGATELFTRLYVFLFMNVYGWGKMLGGQFFRHGHLSPEMAAKSVGDLTGFELTWLFFGYTPVYSYFIGTTQVIGAFLLLSDRTKLLGTMLLVPVLLNIIVVDSCFGVPSGALTSAVIYLLLLMLLLWFNRQQVMAVWQKITQKTANSESGNVVQYLIAMAMVAALFLLELKVLR